MRKRRRKRKQTNDRRGKILVVAVILLLALAVSGLAYKERLMGVSKVPERTVAQPATKSTPVPSPAKRGTQESLDEIEKNVKKATADDAKEPVPEEPPPAPFVGEEEDSSTSQQEHTVDEPEPIPPQDVDIPEEPADEISDGDASDDGSVEAGEGDDEPSPIPHETSSSEAERDEAYGENLAIVGPEAKTASNMQIWRSWIRRLSEQHEAGRVVQLLKEKIRQMAPNLMAGERISYTLYRDTNVLRQAIDLCYLSELVGAEHLDAFLKRGATTTGDSKGKETSTPTSPSAKNSPAAFLQWAIAAPSCPLHRLLQTYKLNSGDPSQMAYALDVFYQLWGRTKERDRDKYLSLAVACSLVRREIAESPGLVRVHEAPLLSMPEVYDYYRDADVHHRLRTNIKKLSPTELLYVVDVRLPLSEFMWAQKELNYTREKWGESYDSVEYMMERATQNDDPYTTYTFEELREKGGVCRDRGYFACTTARCRGIPAVYIVGDGDRGPHAWVGLLVADKTWSTHGSYGYNTGRFVNPCSGKALHESTLLARNKNLTDDKLEPAADCMLLSEFLCRLNCPQEALAAAKYVTIAYPLLTAGWVNCIEVMDFCGKEMVPMAAWKRLHCELEHLSSKNGELLDLAQDVQTNRIMSEKGDNAKRLVLKKSGKKVEHLVDIGRVDLMVDALERQAVLYVRSKDTRGLSSFFKQHLKSHVNRADIFDEVLACYRRMIEQYVKQIDEDGLLDEKKKILIISNLWKTAAKDADGLFSKNAFKGGDFFAIKRHHALMHHIADFWRNAGDEVKASRIERYADNRLEESQDASTPKKKRK